MSEIVAPIWALYWLAFTLGLRHGFDPDHLTVIDGIARANAVRNVRVARSSGILFSLGHGLVVVAVALGDALFAAEWQPPSWLETSGILISVAVLLGLGFVNLRALAVTSSAAMVAPQGLRAQFLLRTLKVDDPLRIAAAGMFFAVSVDTLLLAALFATLSFGQGGFVQVTMTALAFTAGMMAVDGLNGIVFTSLVRQADRARVVSRVVTAAVAGLSILLGVGILIGLLVPDVANWVADHSLWLGVAIAGMTCLSFGFAKVRV
jgi:nickel/cobalt transporter (NiCoT) family protein